MSMLCSDKLPVGLSEIWTHMRDHAKARTPLEAFYLMEARTYCAPSKAHKRRLLKLRPRITRPPVRPEPDCSERKHFNSARQLGDEARAYQRGSTLIERWVKTNEPVRAPATTSLRPPVTYGKLKEDAWPTPEQLDARIAQLAADHERAQREAAAVRG